MARRESKLICSNVICGFEREVNSNEKAVTTISNPSKSKSMEPLVLDGITETLPRTKVDCPKCGHHEAFWVMRQTRAADEPTTRIYRCAKCGHTWREY